MNGNDKNINSIVNDGRCSSCGVCVSVCPKKCISLELINKSATVLADNNICNKCGICYSMCPFSEFTNLKKTIDIEEYNLGEHRQILCAATKDKKLLFDCTSGGVATSIIAALLENKTYDSAFVVKGYGADGLYYTDRVTAPEELFNSSKSRYVTVSHERSIEYMLNHPDEKIIFVGVSCAIKGILKCIEKNRLDRSNYLLLGLFCDRALSYGVFDYFKDHPKCKGKRISEFNFRDKRFEGWPGNVRIGFEDGTFVDLSSEERITVKDYFTPEACLYCLNKLNTFCDIAMGDNYIPSNGCKEGVSSVIVRTDIGERVWNIVRSRFDAKNDSKEDLLKSQVISTRRDNYIYARIKGILPGCPSLIKNVRLYIMYYRKKRYIKMGQKTYNDTYLAIQKENNKRRVYWFFMRVLGYPHRLLNEIGNRIIGGRKKV